MIYAIGDSHAKFCFHDIPGVEYHHIGSITMRRVSHKEDPLIEQEIAKINLVAGDYLIFCFGEIDVRCHAKPIIDYYKGMTAYELLKEWVENYASRIALLDKGGVRIALASIVPPTSKEINVDKVKRISYPATGSDEERAVYTKQANFFMASECFWRGWIYLDIYSQYVDGYGMLPSERGDGTVHIEDNEKVKELLKEVSCVK